MQNGQAASPEGGPEGGPERGQVGPGSGVLLSRPLS